uniref:Uncharacterized protein n=1 Tax=Knipowitschia caucasica TaxID=637954 RepID=A0AAV2ITQ6_KNICA
MATFMENLLKKALDFPRDEVLGIERAHRALVAKPNNNSQAKPRSIVVKFASYRTKEEILRRAWQKKEVFCDDERFFVDHDFPTEVIKRRNEYGEAKKVLKENRIKFQTPYPAKMRVFFNDGTRLYQNATEATRDLASRGFAVGLVKPTVTPDQQEIQLLSNWRAVRGRRAGSGGQQDAVRDDAQQLEDPRARLMKHLQSFRRNTDTEN